MKNYLALITPKRAIFIVVAIVAIGAVVSQIKNSPEETTEPVSRTKTVSIQTISKQDTVTSQLEVSGTAIPREYSVVRSLTQGTVEFLVPVGVDIVRGQSLFSIRDANIESAYYNALEQLNATLSATEQRVTQAELAITNKTASLAFAKKSLAITEQQATQNIITTQNSSVSVYGSTKSSLEQVLLTLSSAGLDFNARYIFKDIITNDSDVRAQAESQFTEAVVKFNRLSEVTSKETISTDLDNLYDALSSAQRLLDLNGVVLKNAIPADPYSADLAANKVNQTTINGAVSSVIAQSNALSTTKINNNFSIQLDTNRLELAEIEYENALVSLESAKASAATEVAGAQGRFDVAAYNFSNLTLVSPFSGTVLGHKVNVGEQVSIGQELIEIGNLNIIEIDVNVDAAFAQALRVRDNVVINGNVPGFIAEIEPVGDITSGKVGIVVQSREGVLVSGDIADVTFDLIFEAPASIVIPIKAATIEEVRTTVFVEENGKAVERTITLGDIYGDKVTVTEGLSEGDRLIIPNGVFITEGDKIQEPTQ